jgi:hypothetical protein
MGTYQMTENPMGAKELNLYGRNRCKMLKGHDYYIKRQTISAVYQSQFLKTSKIIQIFKSGISDEESFEEKADLDEILIYRNNNVFQVFIKGDWKNAKIEDFKIIS